MMISLHFFIRDKNLIIQEKGREFLLRRMLGLCMMMMNKKGNLREIKEMRKEMKKRKNKLDKWEALSLENLKERKVSFKITLFTVSNSARFSISKKLRGIIIQLSSIIKKNTICIENVIIKSSSRGS